MGKIFERFALGAGGLGLLLYVVWSYYATVQIAAIIVSAGLIAITVITRLTRKRWDHPLLVSATTATFATIFIVVTDRKSMGAIAAGLIMLAVVILIFHETTKSPKKKSS